MGKQKTFEYPDHLIQAQRALAAVQAERRSHLASLPVWSWDLEGVKEGLAGGQRAESARLEEAERQAAHVVSADGYWATLSGADRVDARSQLKQAGAPVPSDEALQPADRPVWQSKGERLLKQDAAVCEMRAVDIDQECAQRAIAEAIAAREAGEDLGWDQRARWAAAGAAPVGAAVSARGRGGQAGSGALAISWGRR